jgi:serine/threonine-protein kinase
MATTHPCTVCGEPRTPDLPCGRCLFEREPPPHTIHHGTIELHEELGGGAMGTVFRGYQVQLGRDVAVKVVAPNTPEGNRRLLREASAMARLQHPNILPVLDVGEEGSHAYIVMAFAPGGTLAAQLPLDEPRVIAIGCALADALEHAHQRGVIHCDIKPENVLLDADGRPLLADFSIARVIADARTTAHNRGTPYFIAPEVLAGGAPDARSDIFSLGVLLHHARHGKLPTVGRAAPTRRPLDGVIARAMDEDPARRHASAGAMRDALRALEEGRRRTRSRPVRGGWATIVALVGAGTAASMVKEPWRTGSTPSLAGAWHMRSEPVNGRGGGRFVVEVTGDRDAFVMDYRSGLMRCTFTGQRCEGTWYGRSGDGWYYLDLSDDGATFVGRWGYRGDHMGSAEIRGTRVRTGQ